MKFSGVLATILFLGLPAADIVQSQPVQQYEVHGVVLDADTREPIPTVHVYISQTTIGTATKHDGTFRFTTDMSGTHVLVFSFVGYRTEIRELNFYEDKRPYYEVRLTAEPLELDQVEVTASNKEWQENFETFSRNFIGTTGAAQLTEIENPWVIDFERDEDGNFVAQADQPITVYNYAIGYKLQVDLIEFRWPPRGAGGYYLFYSSFSELEPKNNRQRRQWERNRRNIYQGSFEHFLRCLYENNLKKNDFDVVVPDTHNSVEIPEVDSLSMAWLRLNSNIPGLKPEDVKAYQLIHPVDVLFGKRWFNTNRARSRVVPMARNGIFLVSNQARLVNPVSLRLDGRWSADRVANLLPVDYSLEE